MSGRGTWWILIAPLVLPWALSCGGHCPPHEPARAPPPAVVVRPPPEPCVVRRAPDGVEAEAEARDGGWWRTEAQEEALGAWVVEVRRELDQRRGCEQVEKARAAAGQ